MNMAEQFNKPEMIKHIKSLAPFVEAIMTASSKKPDPQLAREKELLSMIIKITDNETANKARDLYHSQYHAYDFDTYLSLLLELCNLLESGVSENDAFQLINAGCSSSYHGFKAMLDL